MFVLTILLAYPLGKYIASIFEGQRTILDPVLNPIEKFFFQLSKIDSNKEMNWKEHMVALLILNAVWFLLGMIILMNQ